jgi:hypothetical protein
MKKSSIILSVCLFLGVYAASAQKVVNDANAEIRSVGSFHSISVASGIDLYLSPGNEETVVVSASDTKLRDKIKTEVKDGKLKIYIEYKSNIQINWNNNKKWLKAYVSYKTLKALSGSGGSDIMVVGGSIKEDNLDLSLSGGSDFTGEVNVNTLVIDQSGGSDSDIKGTAKDVKVNISGGSDIDAFGLVADNCTINASGGSDARLNVSTKLVANASGGSDIDVKGKCDITKNTSGASDVTRRNK